MHQCAQIGVIIESGVQVASIPMDRDHMQTLAEWMGSIDGEDLEGQPAQAPHSLPHRS